MHQKFVAVINSFCVLRIHPNSDANSTSSFANSFCARYIDIFRSIFRHVSSSCARVSDFDGMKSSKNNRLFEFIWASLVLFCRLFLFSVSLKIIGGEQNQF